MTPLAESYWPATHELALAETTCGGVLRAAAARWPERLALLEADGPPARRRRWTWAALLAEAEDLARVLAARYPPGTHVAIWGGNCPEWVLLQFGLALAGLVMVTINPAARAGELGWILRQSRSRGVFLQPQWRGTDLGAVLAEACREQGIAPDCVVRFDELPPFIASAPRAPALPEVDASRRARCSAITA
jgi:fatty-acyl-CoA synthase